MIALLLAVGTQGIIPLIVIVTYPGGGCQVDLIESIYGYCY